MVVSKEDMQRTLGHQSILTFRGKNHSLGNNAKEYDQHQRHVRQVLNLGSTVASLTRSDLDFDVTPPRMCGYIISRLLTRRGNREIVCGGQAAGKQAIRRALFRLYNDRGTEFRGNEVTPIYTISTEFASNLILFSLSQSSLIYR